MTATETSATVRPPRQHAAVSTPAISEKAQARMIRQKILEHEQHAEELEALQVTPVRRRIFSPWPDADNEQEELKTLRESFAAVKADFVDLDGQSWETPAAREMLVNWVSHPRFLLPEPAESRSKCDVCPANSPHDRECESQSRSCKAWCWSGVDISAFTEVGVASMVDELEGTAP